MSAGVGAAGRRNSHDSLGGLVDVCVDAGAQYQQDAAAFGPRMAAESAKLAGAQGDLHTVYDSAHHVVVVATGNANGIRVGVTQPLMNGVYNTAVAKDVHENTGLVIRDTPISQPMHPLERCCYNVCEKITAVALLVFLTSIGLAVGKSVDDSPKGTLGGAGVGAAAGVIIILIWFGRKACVRRGRCAC